VREGFDSFIAGHHQRAFLYYAEASEMGYEIAQSNAAYLLDRKYVAPYLLLPGSSPQEDDVMLWSLHFHQRAAEQDNAESFVAIGNA
jgi:TPR repeat protein